MIINRKGIISHISKIGYPNFIWYPISMLIPQYGANLIYSKLGVTDPKAIQFLQDEFSQARQEASEGVLELLETHSFRFDKCEWYFHLADNNERSVTVFLERGLSFGAAAPTGPYPLGYAWAILEPSSTPDAINQGLFCDDLKFAKALHRKLWKVMGW
jgi:hypothetical protein